VVAWTPAYAGVTAQGQTVATILVIPTKAGVCPPLYLCSRPLSLANVLKAFKSVLLLDERIEALSHKFIFHLFSGGAGGIRADLDPVDTVIESRFLRGHQKGWIALRPECGDHRFGILRRVQSGDLNNQA